MATNFADIAGIDLASRQSQRSFEHKFFIGVAAFFPLMTLAGFLPNFIFDTPLKPPPATPLLIAHAITMSLWIILFAVQSILISAKQVKAHITLGMFGVALAATMIVVGVLTGYAAAARGAAFPGFTNLEFFIVPIGDMVTFAILFAAAIYYRKNAANHKRLMLVTMVNFLPPSTARLPLPFIPDLGAIWLFGVPTVVGLALLAGDTYRTGKLDKAFAAGISLVILSGPIRVAICRTEAWSHFAAWILS
ncbi:MAG: hypothetical protein QM785_19640 [Pyrinomonadaceae bacterium]